MGRTATPESPCSQRPSQPRGVPKTRWEGRLGREAQGWGMAHRRVYWHQKGKASSARGRFEDRKGCIGERICTKGRVLGEPGDSRLGFVGSRPRRLSNPSWLGARHMQCQYDASVQDGSSSGDSHDAAADTKARSRATTPQVHTVALRAFRL